MGAASGSKIMRGSISEALCSKETFKDNLETVSECEEDVGLSMRRDLSKD